MTEQNPEPTPSPEPTPAPVKATKEDTPKRFAAYDKDYLRFVGGTHDTKTKARDAAKERGAKNVEIREV